MTAPADLAALDADVVACRRCPRLIAWCSEVARTKRAAYADEDYWGGPVPGFGVSDPRVWIVGLAPAAHGANRTGRMFTGDRSGDWLFAALHRGGLATSTTSTHRGDGQALIGTRITATVHCAPPDNKPTTEERHACATWLDAEIALVEPSVRVMIALGGIAWTALLAALARGGWQVARVPFGHDVDTTATSPAGRTVILLASYHPSQQNTFTGRLTEPMLDAVVNRAAAAAGLR